MSLDGVAAEVTSSDGAAGLLSPTAYLRKARTTVSGPLSCNLSFDASGLLVNFSNAGCSLAAGPPGTAVVELSCLGFRSSDDRVIPEASGRNGTLGLGGTLRALGNLSSAALAPADFAAPAASAAAAATAAGPAARAVALLALAAAAAAALLGGA